MSIHQAAHGGRLKRIKWLVESGGVDPDSRNKYGMTPLHLAAVKNRVKVCKYLIEAGADPELENNVQQTAFDMNPGNAYLAEVLGSKLLELKQRKELKKLRAEQRLRDAMMAKKFLQQQRIMFKGTAAAKKVVKRLEKLDPRDRIPKYATFSEPELFPEKKIKAVPDRTDLWAMTQRRALPGHGRQSRLRHAKRFGGALLRDRNFHLDRWCNEDDGRFEHWIRGSGWASRNAKRSTEDTGRTDRFYS
jgi:hypothetical protein